MRCVMCNRPLLHAAPTVPTKAGPLLIGPKCAKRAGLTAKSERALTLRKAPAKPQAADSRQCDWLEAQEGTYSGAGSVFSVGVAHG